MAGKYSKLALESKATLERFVEEIRPRMERYFVDEAKKESGYNAREKEFVRHMVEHLREYLFRPQKRLRPSFVYYGHLLSNSSLRAVATDLDERIWKAAMAIEIVHASILMHDDFMDEDEVRRGGPTTHKYYEMFMGGGGHYGAAMAVTAGDLGWNLGYELLAKSEFEADRIVEAMEFFFRTIVDTAYGQAFDVTMPLYENWGEEDVMAVHMAKTARYTYENPLMVGAILGGVSKKARTILHDYAMDGGVAFQLQDDILGVFGTPEKTGKSADSDLLQGKCTLLVLKVFEKGSKSQVEAVRKVWGKRSRDEAGDLDLTLAKEAITESGALAYSVKLAKELAEKAARSAEKLRKLDLNTTAIDYIQGIAEYMVEREV